MKNSCKECPWKCENRFSKKWRQNIFNLIKSGWRKNTKHNCHMVAPVWGDMSEKTICAGSKNQKV